MQFMNASGVDEYEYHGELVVRRTNLMEEELEETIDALQSGNREHILKELCDLQYVLSGTIVALSLEDVFDEAFDRVHYSNMMKVEGEITIDENGKVMKPIGWKKPYLEDLV